MPDNLPAWAQQDQPKLPAWAQSDEAVKIKPSVVPPGTFDTGVKVNPSTAISQLEAAPAGVAKDIGGQIGQDFDVGKSAVMDAPKEFQQGDHIKAMVDAIMGTAQMATAPITGIIKKAPDYIDPGMVPEVAEGGALAGAEDATKAPKPEGAPAVPLSGETPKPAVPIPAQAGPRLGAAIPQPAGAQAVGTADILQGTINDRLKTEAKAPGFVDGLKSAGHAIQGLFAPSTLDASGGRAASAINKAQGRATRNMEQTNAALEAFKRQTASMGLQEQLDLDDFIQNRSTMNEPIPEVKPVLDAIKNTFLERRRKLEALPQTEQMGFIDDYLPQAWKDPGRLAQQFGSKEGGGGFTKAREIPSYAEGIRAGLEPVATDPIEITLRYIENVDKFIASNEMLSEALDQGDVVYRAAANKPEGWLELTGGAAQRRAPPGQKAYAPEGWARVYNNFNSKRPEGPAGTILQGIQKATNTVTAFKLGLSAYHATMMAQEGIASGIAGAFKDLRTGNPARAAANLVKAPFKPITSVARGRQFQKAYLDGTGSPELQRIVNAATDANFRVVGKGRVADEYRFTGEGSFWNSWKKGALKAEAIAALKDVRDRPVAGALRQISKAALRTLETISDPLFKVYIPMIKNGAMYDGLERFLKANPNATDEELTAYANKFADEIDNRFGEMNQDRIFWQKTQKLIAQSMLVSYSYEMGTARALGGAAVDAAKMAVGKGGWTDRMDYAVVGLPMAYGLMAAVYQYLHTGKGPESLQDLLAPRTGGIGPDGKPERATIPSYLPQVAAMYEHPGEELSNKLNPGVQLAVQLATGKDWRGDPISKVDDPIPAALKKYGELVGSAMAPISLESSNQPTPGSKIGSVERFAGVRLAPMYERDPEGYRQMTYDQGLNEDAEKAWHDEVQRRRQIGSTNFYGKSKFIARYKKQHAYKPPAYKGAQ